jgi:replicative superfamily II helicase
VLTLCFDALRVLQVLIFVHSRKETAKTALYLKQTALDNDHLAKFMRDDSASREILQVFSFARARTFSHSVMQLQGHLA